MGRGLTRDELQSLTDETCARALALSARFGPAQWQAGADWYANANAVAVRLADATDWDTYTAAAVLAVLSPRNSWESNQKDAALALHGELDGFVALGDNVVKAWRIVDGEDPEDVLGGPKVRAFWSNIANPSGSRAVTIDTWMVKLLLGDRPSRFLERKGVYDAVADGVRLAADIMGERPLVLQAALWIDARGSAE